MNTQVYIYMSIHTHLRIYTFFFLCVCVCVLAFSRMYVIDVVRVGFCKHHYYGYYQ